MATVETTKHLHEFLPALRGDPLTVKASTVAEAVRAVERIAPGFTYYICDQRGCLRTHVNIFVGQAVFKAPLSSIYPGLVPFIACAIAALAVVTYIPQLSLWILRFLT